MEDSGLLITATDKSSYAKFMYDIYGEACSVSSLLFLDDLISNTIFENQPLGRSSLWYSQQSLIHLGGSLNIEIDPKNGLAEYENELLQKLAHSLKPARQTPK